jgi:hypothetical protein
MDAGGPRLRAIGECLQRDEPLDDIPPAPSPRLTKRSSASYFTRSRCRLAIGTTSADKWTAGKPQAVSSVFVKQKAPRNEAQTARAWAGGVETWAGGVEISALNVQTRPEASCSIDQCKRAAEAALSLAWTLLRSFTKDCPAQFEFHARSSDIMPPRLHLGRDGPQGRRPC